jgi:TetR/AcrR family transcriptional regulator, transcriptional repressor for nem operon
MPRVSRQKTELNRVEITQTAVRLFRARGLHGVSVNEVMKEAGLTHGGFYGHFDSKEALANAACGQAFTQSSVTWREMIAKHRKKKNARKSIVNHYLAPTKRDDVDDTCPVVAFSADVAHEEENAEIHSIFTQGLQDLLDAYMSTFESTDFPKGPSAIRQVALVEYSLMVGAMTLARATGKTALSDEILKSARAFLNAGSLHERASQDGADTARAE